MVIFLMCCGLFCTSCMSWPNATFSSEGLEGANMFQMAITIRIRSAQNSRVFWDCRKRSSFLWGQRFTAGRDHSLLHSNLSSQRANVVENPDHPQHLVSPRQQRQEPTLGPRNLPIDQDSLQLLPS